MKIKDDHRALWILGIAMILLSLIHPNIDYSDSILNQIYWIILSLAIIGGAFYWISKL